MKKIQVICTVLLIITSGILLAVEKPEPSPPDTGDTELDESLSRINKAVTQKPGKKSARKLNQYTQRLAADFQIPEYRVEELFSIYEFTAADALMSVSIADASGQPLKNVAGLYFNNKKAGWKAVLKQLMIAPGSKVYKQIKKDAAPEY